MVRLTIGLTAPSTRAARELLDGLRFLEPPTRLQVGCRCCANCITRDLRVYHIEEWATEADMRARVCSSEFTSLLGIIEAAPDPCVQFDFIASTRGLDYVAEVRRTFGG